MSRARCKSPQKSPPERRHLWDPERELPRHLGYKLVPCKYCKRTFFANRIDRHQEICGPKRLEPKRPVYDSIKFRLTGTVAEGFLNRIPDEDDIKGPLNPYWRENREFFKSGISLLRDEQRLAKATAVGLEGRGRQLHKLAHYVQCPICGRRFNEHAVTRHIAYCTNYVSKQGNTSSSTSPFAPASTSGSKSRSKR